MSLNPVRRIAGSEFSNVVRNPVIIVTVIVLLMLVILNAAGCSKLLPLLQQMGFPDVFLQGWSNAYNYTLLILTFLSLGLGVLSIPEERSNMSLRVLLTKPLYRKDVIAGKFLGGVSFLLLLNLFVAVMNIALLLVFYGGPSSITEVEKICLFTITMGIYSSLTFGIMILFSLIVKGFLESMVFAMTYLYLTWYVHLPNTLSTLQWVNPVYQCNMAVRPNISLSEWVGGSLPVVMLMIAELMIVLIVNIILFNKEEI